MAKKKAVTPKSRAKSSHGGHRAGAGRKPADFAKLRAEIIAETDSEICRNLPQLIKNMLYLANGGYERVEEKHTDAEGVGIMTLTERKISTAEPDRAANQYLIDRALGKPKQAVEMAGPDGGAIPFSVEQAIAKVYGEDEDS